jgi:hypothetical protein
MTENLTVEVLVIRISEDFPVGCAREDYIKTRFLGAKAIKKSCLQGKGAHLSQDGSDSAPRELVELDAYIRKPRGTNQIRLKSRFSQLMHTSGSIEDHG